MKKKIVYKQRTLTNAHRKLNSNKEWIRAYAEMMMMCTAE